MSRMARRINLTLTYLIITTMILSGIQVMLPALGYEWYNQNEQNLEDDSSKIEYSAPNDKGMYESENIPYVGIYAGMFAPRDFKTDEDGKIHTIFQNTNEVSGCDLGTSFKDIVYGTKDPLSGIWTFEDTNIQCWSSINRMSLTLDDSNNPIIGIVSGGNNDVYVTSKSSSGTWNNVELVDITGTAGVESISIEYSGNTISLIYGIDETSGGVFDNKIYFATKSNSGTWSTTLISSNVAHDIFDLKSNGHPYFLHACGPITYHSHC